jgi:hypothetical protein
MGVKKKGKVIGYFCCPFVAQCTHRVFEALPPGVNSQPLPGGLAASACCSCMGIVTIVIATTPTNASAATIAITKNVVSFISSS